MNAYAYLKTGATAALVAILGIIFAPTTFADSPGAGFTSTTTPTVKTAPLAAPTKTAPTADEVANARPAASSGGSPSSFEDMEDGHVLSAPEIRKFVLGSTFSGWDHSAYWSYMGRDGTITVVFTAQWQHYTGHWSLKEKGENPKWCETYANSDYNACYSLKKKGDSVVFVPSDNNREAFARKREAGKNKDIFGG